ncbi:MAG: 3'-5' exonuclease, partial [Nitriliruptoraceae bacterium]
IAVLVRKRHQADQLQQALRTAGIPSVVRSDDSVLCTAEATTVQWLIDAMLAPSDERAVRRALASDVYGYRAVALATLDDGDLDREISRFTDLRRRWDTAGFAAAFRHALGDGNTVERLVRTHRGERAVTNLLHIAEIVDHAERARRLHPEHTAMWLRRQRQQPTSRSDEHVEQRLESDGEAVQLITIHSAKGLEFPVVWVPFAWDGPARIRSDNGSVVRVGREGGTVIDVNQDPFDPDRRRHRARDTEQSWQEDLRLLYVALTRAKHQCVVHLGPVNGSEFAAISRLVHHTRLVVDDRLRQPKIAATPDPTQLGDDDWQRRLDDLVAGAPGALAWSELTPPSGANPSTEPGTADRVDSLSARTLDRDLDVAWQRTSFSALTRHGSELHEPATAAAGYDMMDTGIEPVPLARFPRGAAIGTMLHDIFEHLDFPAAADTLDAMIGRAARGHNLTAPQRQALRTGILQAVDTPLGPTVENVRLADLHADDRLNELDFDLPLAGGYTATDRTVSLHAIADVFDQYSQPGSMHADYARRLRRHGHQHVRGFLTGSIDLIARVGDSYMLADYKSNWLGHTGDDGTAISTQAHYHPTLLRDEMIVHDYVLQYHLYLVALHRYLHGRLGRDYDYDRHVAGAVYLFVRGMSPSGHGHGVFADRPPYQLVAALDDLLRQGTA